VFTTRSRSLAASVSIGKATELQELEEQESLRLLHLLAPQVLEDERAKVRKLVQAVGGLPLALTLMGNYLRTHAYGGQTRRITSALERLSKIEERLLLSEPHGPVERHSSLSREVPLSLHSVIAITDQRLTQEARAAFYALSVFPAKPSTFSEETALAVIEGKVELLDMLFEAGLLEGNRSGRYLLHQVIADYARLHLPGSEAEVAQERLIRFMIDALEVQKENDAWLEQEYPLIVMALESAEERAADATFIRAIKTLMSFVKRRGSSSPGN
jgi:hypothetical protein